MHACAAEGKTIAQSLLLEHACRCLFSMYLVCWLLLETKQNFSSKFKTQVSGGAELIPVTSRPLRPESLLRHRSCACEFSEGAGTCSS